ncbi:MAG: glucose-6-phosphate isomerase family protein [Candidatus Aenigmarchaeota archaeon]|nr:glucose-6-phosphate isomerase family protein [Candidatus Aenigmarchaeota archaeon]
MDFGYALKESNGELTVNFKQKVVGWKRLASEMVEDKVVLDLKNAKKMIETKREPVVYEQYNLWKSIDRFKEIFKKTKIASDLTLLNFGVFSTSNEGELFSTYGHAHETECGEAYFVLKNSCFLILSDKKTYETFILHLKEADYLFIHPKFLHRTACDKKDVLFATFYPELAGHDYKIIKNRGFPFHVFRCKNRTKIVKNPKFKNSRYELIEKVKTRVNPIKLLERNPEKLKDILENPEKYKKIYFIGR